MTQGSLAATNYTFTFVNGTLTVNPAVAQLTAPLKNTMLSGSSVNFTWSHETNAVSYRVVVGLDARRVQDLASVTTPQPHYHGQRSADRWQLHLCHARPAVNRRHQLHSAGLRSTYVAYAAIAVMISPLPGTMFTGTTVTFNWVAGAGSSAYWIDVGSTPGGNDYYQSGNLGSALTATVNSLPTDGSTSM